MPLITTRRAKNENMIDLEVKNIKGKKPKVPVIQSLAHMGSDSYYTIPSSNPVSSTSISNGTYHYFDLEVNTLGLVEDLYFRFKITCSSSAVTVLPGHYLVKDWRLMASKGQLEICKWYPENIILWQYAFLDDRGRKFNEKMSMFHLNEIKSEGQYRYTDGKDEIFRVGDSRYVYLPVPLSFFHLKGINMNHLSRDLRFEIHFNNDWVVSGSASNLSLDGIDLVCRSHEITQEDKMYEEVLLKKQPHEYIFLDYVQLNNNSKTLTASTETLYQLDAFSNIKGAFLLFVIKPSTAPVASDRSQITFMEFGDLAKIDFKNPTNESLLGNGQGLLQTDIYEIFKNNLNNLPIQGFYILPFSENVKESLLGIVNGFHQFDSRNDQLSIIFGAAGTAHSFDISMNNTANDAGYYQIALGGDLTDNLVYNTSAANIQTAINNLKCVKDRGYTCSVTNTMEADCSLNFHQHRDGRIDIELGIPQVIPSSLNDGGIPAYTETVNSVYGIKGFNTSATYQLVCYCAYFRKIQIDTNGNVEVYNL